MSAFKVRNHRIRVNVSPFTLERIRKIGRTAMGFSPSQAGDDAIMALIVELERERTFIGQLMEALAEANQRLERALRNGGRKARKIPPCLDEFKDQLFQVECPRAVQSCIYFLTHRNHLVYIGLSRNLFPRLAQHLISGKDFDRVFYMIVPPNKLFETESKLIKRFRPPYNFAKAEKLQDRNFLARALEGKR